MAYKHGVYVREQATKLIAPVLGTAGLQVVVGTAPVNMLPDPAAACNTPLLVQSYAEAVGAVGYSSDFEAYTLCESISVNFQVVGTGPMVFINVLDPAKHSADIEETELEVVEGVAHLEATGAIPGTLKVLDGETELKKDEDYTTLFNEDGTLSIALIGSAAATLKVSGKRLDPSLVTPDDIIGGVDVNTGKETGLEVIRQIYPKLAMTPGILLAPRFSANPNVSAALQAKTKDINGVFKAVTVIDIDSTAEGATKYTDVKEQKERQAVTDPNAYAVWGYGKLGDVVYCLSLIHI